jgi:hypothetical protein
MALFVESGSAARAAEDATVMRQASRSREAQRPC